MNSIEDTAEQFNLVKPLQQKVMQIIQTIQSANYYIQQFKHRAKDTSQSVSSAQSQVRKYNFSGQHTDIAFCNEFSRAVNLCNEFGPINLINDILSIQDYKLRSNVLDSFNKAKTEGYLYYDNNDGNFVLTEKGNNYINSQSFIEQFEKDQKNYLINNELNNTVAINLSGTKDDLNIFKYVDSINLNKLSYDDPEKFKQVVSYFEKCEKYDFVKISKDGIVTPTNKTKDMLSQYTGQINMQKININNLDKIIDTAKSTQATVKAGSTAAKAGTTASAGAATAGVSVAVQAVVEMSKAGIKAFDEAMKLHQKQNRKTAAMNRRA